MKSTSSFIASLNIEHESIEILYCSALYASMNQLRERLKKQLITPPSEEQLSYLLDSHKSEVTLAEDHSFMVNELKELTLNLSFDAKRLKDLLEAGRHVFSLVEQPYNFFCNELILKDESQTKLNIAWLQNRYPIAPVVKEFRSDKLSILLTTLSWLINTDSDEGLELKLRKAKEAWRSKKHRDSQNGKKACSYMLSEEHIELLEKLCKRNRRKKNEMIGILIEDACEQLGITKKPPRM